MGGGAGNEGRGEGGEGLYSLLTSFLQGQSLEVHDYVFWCGDLNYRIDLPSSISKDHIAHQRWDKLCKQDQLIKQKKLNKVGEGGRDGGRKGESRIRRRRGIEGKKERERREKEGERREKEEEKRKKEEGEGEREKKRREEEKRKEWQGWKREKKGGWEHNIEVMFT